MGLIYVLLQFSLLVIAMATHPRWFSSPSMPAGPWHSGTTFWCTASPPPPRPRSGTGPGRLPGLRGSTSASLWAPHTSEPRARDQTKVHWATHSPRQNPNWATHPAARLSWVSQSLRDDPSVLSTSLLVDYIWWEKDYQKSSVIVKKKGEKKPQTQNRKQWPYLTSHDCSWGSSSGRFQRVLSLLCPSLLHANTIWRAQILGMWAERRRFPCTEGINRLWAQQLPSSPFFLSLAGPALSHLLTSTQLKWDEQRCGSGAAGQHTGARCASVTPSQPLPLLFCGHKG